MLIHLHVHSGMSAKSFHRRWNPGSGRGLAAPRGTPAYADMAIRVLG
jgi:hypothetical protein